MKTLEVYSDNIIESQWFINTFPVGLGYNFETKIIQDRGKNPHYIEQLILYDRPDIILCYNKRPILVGEKTREVPTGHNIGQRLARLVRSIELGVPTFKFFPFDARKHGAQTTICNLNVRVLEAFIRMSSIHSTPLVAINWKCDEDGELICDGSEDDGVKSLIKSFVKSNFNKEAKEFLSLKTENEKELKARVAVRAKYAKPPPSVEIVSTLKFLNKVSFFKDKQFFKTLSNKKTSCIYTIGMSEGRCRREDPYTGMQFLYDYVFCRTGPSPDDKKNNLILHFPKISVDIWKKKNPNDPNRKSSNWYLTANALVFKDGLIHLR